MLYQYDPSAVTVIYGGHIITGYADGTFVNVQRNEPMWAIKVGADGIATRVKSSNKSGRVTVTLQQSSPSNDVLSGLAIADEQAGTGALPILVRDGSGRSLATAGKAWNPQMPDAEFGKEVGDRVWVFETDSLNLFIGGNG